MYSFDQSARTLRYIAKLFRCRRLTQARRVTSDTFENFTLRYILYFTEASCLTRGIPTDVETLVVLIVFIYDHRRIIR